MLRGRKGREREEGRKWESKSNRKKWIKDIPGLLGSLPTFRVALEVIMAAFSMLSSMSTAAWAALGDFTSIAKTLW
jgi:hypothetical protein